MAGQYLDGIPNDDGGLMQQPNDLENLDNIDGMTGMSAMEGVNRFNTQVSEVNLTISKIG